MSSPEDLELARDFLLEERFALHHRLLEVDRALLTNKNRLRDIPHTEIPQPKVKYNVLTIDPQNSAVVENVTVYDYVLARILADCTSLNETDRKIFTDRLAMYGMATYETPTNRGGRLYNIVAMVWQRDNQPM